MADVRPFGFATDAEFAQYLVKDIGVATIPGSSFYIDPKTAPQTVRFCFSKRDETLHEAGRRVGEALCQRAPVLRRPQITQITQD